MNRKRALSLALALVLSLGLIAVPSPASALTSYKTQAAPPDAPSFDFKGESPVLNADPNETVTAIVELRTAPLGAKAALWKSGSADKARAELKALDASLRAEQDKVFAGLKAVNARATLRARYTSTLNGFAVELRRKDIAAVRADKRVKNVSLSVTYDAPVTKPGDAGSQDMIFAPSAWAAGATGEGALIAILDSGVDYNHPLLNSLTAAGRLSKAQIDARVAAAGPLNATTGSYYKNDKVVFGYDYANRDEDPMDDNFNNYGHGTHVAGIAAANPSAEGALTGVAYNAQLMAMKVFTTSRGVGTTTDEMLLAALEDAVRLGADAVNMSLGAPAGYTAYEGVERFAYTTVFAAARQAGVTIALSAGNQSYMGLGADYGPSPVLGAGLPYAEAPDFGTVGTPSTERDAVSVASVDNTAPIGAYFLASGRKVYYTDTNMAPLSQVFDGATLPYVVIPNNGDRPDYDGLDVKGKIALIRRGGKGTFASKGENARLAGAALFIVYDNIEEPLLYMDMTGTTLPGAFVSLADGEALVAAADKKASFSAAYFGPSERAAVTHTSSYSSFGVTPDLKIKPEITAPGGHIYSTSPVAMGSYMIMSGTSMASPAVAAASAIVRQRVARDYPALTPSEQTRLAENLLLSTARIVRGADGVPEPVTAQGAGLLDLNGAVAAPAILYGQADRKTKLELGDKLDPQNITVSFRVENLSAAALSFALSDELLLDKIVSSSPGEPAAGVKQLVTLSATRAGRAASVDVTGGTYAGDILTVPAKAGATVTLHYALGAKHADMLAVSPNGYYAYGFAELKPVGAASYSLSVPFLGFVGDWGALPMFDTYSAYDASYASVSKMPLYGQDAMMGLSDDFGSVWPLGYSGQFGVFNASSFCAFSPDGDLAFDQAFPRFYLLRNAKHMWAEIRTPAGALVKTLRDDEPEFAYKACVRNGVAQYTDTAGLGMAWDGTDANGAKVPEGKYVYTAYALPDYSGAAPQKKSFDVIVDVTAPELTYDFKSEGGKSYLRLAVSDNHMLSAVALYAKYTYLWGEFDMKSVDSGWLDISSVVAQYGDLENAKRYLVVQYEDYARHFVQYRFGPEPPPEATLWGTSLRNGYNVGNMPAYIEIMIEGENLELAEWTARIVRAADNTPATGDVFHLTNFFGPNRFYVPKMPPPSETDYRLAYYKDGVQVFLTPFVLLDFADDFFSPKALPGKDNATTLIRFAGIPSPAYNEAAGVYTVYVDGVAFEGVAQYGTPDIVVKTPYRKGAKVRIESVRFNYELPDYVFNFNMVCE